MKIHIVIWDVSDYDYHAYGVLYVGTDEQEARKMFDEKVQKIKESYDVGMGVIWEKYENNVREFVDSFRLYDDEDD